MMSSESGVDFGFKGDTCSGTDFNFGCGISVDILPQVASGHGQIDLQVENDLSTSQLELECEVYSFSYRPPVYIPPPGFENWNSTTYQPEALYLPVPVSSPPAAVDFPIPPSSYDGSAPPKFIGEKRPRLAEFSEENILPEHEFRKGVKTSFFLNVS
jgi:hypothetical protein